jgi:hypothetical protein
MITWLNGPHFSAAIQKDSLDEAVSFRLVFRVETDIADGSERNFYLVDSAGENKAHCTQTDDGVTYCCLFACKPRDGRDTEFRFHLFSGPDRFLHEIVVRFSACLFDDAGIRISPEEYPLFEAAITGLRFHAYQKYDQITFVKKYTDGFSGALTLAFVPKTIDSVRDSENPSEDHSSFEPIRRRWTKPRLVKISRAASALREYEASRRYVGETLNGLSIHPDHHLVVSGPTEKTATKASDTSGERYGTLISSYMGPHSPLEFRRMDIYLRSSVTEEAVASLVQRVFDGLGGWHDAFVMREIDHYTTLTDKLDFYVDGDAVSRKRGIDEILVDFRNHWKEGKELPSQPLMKLLHKLKSTKTRWSVIHGDLQPRNIFVDDNGTPWFLDFEHTGEGPTLFDHAVFELHTRTCLLSYRAVSPDLAERTVIFERKLMESLWSMNMDVPSIVETIRPVTSNSALEIETVVNTIVGIRRSVAPYSVGGPLRIDYLSLLYLASLKWLRRIAGKSIESVRHIISLTYVLEDVLLRHFMLTDQDDVTAARRIEGRSKTIPFGFNFLAGHATSRLRYFFDQPYAERYFPEITRLRGIVQPLVHHLDVFDHTLLVLENLESEFDVGFPNWVDVMAETLSSDPLLQRVVTFLRGETGNTFLKWVALFHDAGKYDAWDYNRERIQHLGHERRSRVIAAEFFSHNPIEDKIADEVFRSLFGDDDGGGVPTGLVEELILTIITKHHHYHDCFEAPDRPVGGKKGRVQRAYKNLVPDDAYAGHVRAMVQDCGPVADLTVRLLLLVSVDLFGMADIDATGGYPRGKCSTNIEHVLADTLAFSHHFWQKHWDSTTNVELNNYLQQHVPMGDIDTKTEKGKKEIAHRSRSRKEIEATLASHCLRFPEDSGLAIEQLVERSRTVTP